MQSLAANCAQANYLPAASCKKSRRTRIVPTPCQRRSSNNRYYQPAQHEPRRSRQRQSDHSERLAAANSPEKSSSSQRTRLQIHRRHFVQAVFCFVCFLRRRRCYVARRRFWRRWFRSGTHRRAGNLWYVLSRASSACHCCQRDCNDSILMETVSSGLGSFSIDANATCSEATQRNHRAAPFPPCPTF